MRLQKLKCYKINKSFALFELLDGKKMNIPLKNI